MGAAALSGSLDTIYAALNRETLLKVSSLALYGEDITADVDVIVLPRILA
jgi:hypothetical protein